MTLSQKIQAYQPNDVLIDELKDSEILLLVGITGSGKDTIKKALLESDKFYDFISYTTRKPRENYGIMEQNDIDYHFRSLETAGQMMDGGRFIEVKEYAGNVYGTAFDDLEVANSLNKIAVNDIEVQGVAEYKKLFNNVIAIFLMPPNFQEWQRRLRNRYDDQEFEQEWPKRRDAAIRELEHALEVPYYHFVINDVLSDTVDAVKSIADNADHFTRKDDEIRLIARDILQSMRSES